MLGSVRRGMFDPYRKWLGIPEGDRPPTHYQLLAIAASETDPEVINAAVVRQSAYVRNFQSGKHADDATRILNEIAAAKTCLLDKARRAAYDAELNKKKAASAAKKPVASQAAAPRKPLAQAAIAAPPSPDPTHDLPPLSSGYPVLPTGYSPQSVPSGPSMGPMTPAMPGPAPMSSGYGVGTPLEYAAMPQGYPGMPAGYPAMSAGYPMMAMDDDTPWYAQIPPWAMVAGGGTIVALILGVVLYLNHGSSAQNSTPIAASSSGGTVNSPITSGSNPTSSSTSGAAGGTKSNPVTTTAPPKPVTTPIKPPKSDGGSDSGSSSSSSAGKNKPPVNDTSEEEKPQGLQSGTALRGHDDREKGAVHRLEFDSEGAYLLSCSGSSDFNGSLRVWDVQRGAEHGDRNKSFFRRNRSYATAIFLDGRFQIMSVTKGYFDVSQYRGQNLEQQRVDIASNFRFSKATTAAICRDGSIVALGNEEGVCVAESRRKGMAGIIPVAAAVNQLAISADGKLVSAALFDRTVHTWAAKGGGKDAYKPHQIDAQAVGLAYSPDGAKLGVAAENGEVTVWEAGKRTEIFQRSYSKRKLASFAFSPDSEKFVLGDALGTVFVCNSSDGDIIRTFSAESGDSVTAVAMSPDSLLVGTANEHGEVRVWKLDEIKDGEQAGAN